MENQLKFEDQIKKPLQRIYFIFEKLSKDISNSFQSQSSSFGIQNVDFDTLELESNLNFEKFDFLEGLYLWGSRVYGTASETSDWDFIGIMDDRLTDLIEQFRERPNLDNFSCDETFPVFEDKLINLTLIPFSKWIAMVYEHRHQALELIFLSSQFVFKDTSKVRSNFRLDFGVLRRTVTWESQQRFQTSFNRMKMGEEYKAKKDFVHCNRYLFFAQQIIEQKRIYNYQAANQLFYEVIKKPFDKKWYKQTYTKVSDTFKNCFRDKIEFRHFYSQYEVFHSVRELIQKKNNPIFIKNSEGQEFKSNIFNLKTLSVVNFLNLFGLKKLLEEYSSLILCKCSNQLSDLIHFSETYFGPLPTPIDMECNGLILDRSNFWKPVCYFPQDVIYSSSMESNHDSYYYDVDGTVINMYYFKNNWLISTNSDPSGAYTQVGWKHEEDKTQLDTLFWNIFYKNQFKLPTNRKECCFQFVLISPRQRYIVYYPDETLVFRKGFDLERFEFIDPILIAKEYQWATLEKVEVKIEKPLNFVKTLNPFQCPGIILLNSKNFYVTTIKSPAYLAAYYHSISSTIGPFNLNVHFQQKDFLNIIRYRVPWKELLLYFPHLEKSFRETESQFYRLVYRIEKAYEELRYEEDKTFFPLAKERFESFHYILFQLRTGYSQKVWDNLAKCEISSILRYLKEEAQKDS